MIYMIGISMSRLLNRHHFILLEMGNG